MSNRFWMRTAVVLIVGYCLMGRSFAYLGVPPWHLFIGEIVLALFLIAGPMTIRGSWVKIARRLQPFKRLTKIYSLFLLYGVLQVLHGIAVGNPPLTAIRDLAFNYYPIFLLLGIWVGLQKPNLMPRLFRLLAWCNGVYGVTYILFLNRVSWTFPGVSDQVASVPIFGLPEYSFIILLGLLAYEPELKKVWYLLILNGFVLLGMQIRSEWLGLVAGLILWGWVTKNLKRMAAGGAVVILLIACMFLLNVNIPGPQIRGGGEISARDLIGRAIAPLSPDLSAEYTSFSKMDVGTAAWRTLWWASIWSTVNENRVTALVGFGYGFPIGDLSPLIEEGEFIQTPHNVFFYALAYTGWVGVVLLALFQVEVAHLLWRAFKRTGEPCGIVLWTAMLVYALFTPFFEVPQGAIPFFLVIGSAVGASIFAKKKSVNLPAVTPALS